MSIRSGDLKELFPQVLVFVPAGAQLLDVSVLLIPLEEAGIELATVEVLRHESPVIFRHSDIRWPFNQAPQIPVRLQPVSLRRLNQVVMR